MIIAALIIISATLTAIAYCMVWETKKIEDDHSLSHYYKPLFSQDTLDELEKSKWQD